MEVRLNAEVLDQCAKELYTIFLEAGPAELERMGSGQISLGECRWPAWVRLERGGGQTHYGLLRPTLDAGLVELFSPAIPGDPWHLPLEGSVSLVSIRGGTFDYLEVLSEEKVRSILASERLHRELPERRAATNTILAAANPGDHLRVKEYYGGAAGRISSIRQPETPSGTWLIEVEAENGHKTKLHLDCQVVELTPAELVGLWPEGWGDDQDDEEAVRHHETGLLATVRQYEARATRATSGEIGGVSAEVEVAWLELSTLPAPLPIAQRLHRRVLAALPPLLKTLHHELGVEPVSDPYPQLAPREGPPPVVDLGWQIPF